MMKRIALLAPLLFAGCIIHERPAEWIPAREPLTPQAMAQMKAEGMTDESIRRELEYHGVAYKLNTDDLIDLKEAGAGDALLAAATAAPVKTPREAQPVYRRSRTPYHDCSYCGYHGNRAAYFATGLTLGYLFNWGHRHHHHGHRHRW